jgi:hypothetical protein
MPDAGPADLGVFATFFAEEHVHLKAVRRRVFRRVVLDSVTYVGWPYEAKTSSFIG